MIKDLPEGQTHSYNDGCGEPEHNTMTNDWRERFDARFEQDNDPNDRVSGWLCRINGNGTVSIALPENVKSFIAAERALAAVEMHKRCVEAMPNAPYHPPGAVLKNFDLGFNAGLAAALAALSALEPKV